MAGVLSGRRCILTGDREEMRELSALEALENFGVCEVGRFKFPLVGENRSYHSYSHCSGVRRHRLERIVPLLQCLIEHETTMGVSTPILAASEIQRRRN